MIIINMRRKPPQKNIVNELSKYTKELAQLEHGLDLQAGELQILFSDEDVDKFTQNEEAVSKCKIIYLDNNALITEEQLKLFEQNDIKICYIPDYFYRILGYGIQIK